jgi:IS4 transposase
VAGGGPPPNLVPMRLMAVPLPVEKAAAARLKLQRKASKHPERLDPRSLIAAGFVVLATSLPAEIPADEVCAVYRLRGQSELAFKRLKAVLHLDRLPTRTPAGSLGWLYPHLILLLLTADIGHDVLAASP